MAHEKKEKYYKNLKNYKIIIKKMLGGPFCRGVARPSSQSRGG